MQYCVRDVREGPVTMGPFGEREVLFLFGRIFCLSLTYMIGTFISYLGIGRIIFSTYLM
jgi:hypothetical protein